MYQMTIVHNRPGSPPGRPFVTGHLTEDNTIRILMNYILLDFVDEMIYRIEVRGVH